MNTWTLYAKWAIPFVCLFQGFLGMVCLLSVRLFCICRVPHGCDTPLRTPLRGYTPDLKQDCSTSFIQGHLQLSLIYLTLSYLKWQGALSNQKIPFRMRGVDDGRYQLDLMSGPCSRFQMKKLEPQFNNIDRCFILSKDTNKILYCFVWHKKT